MTDPCFVLAIDHRRVMVDACRERKVDLARLSAFKTLGVRAVAQARRQRPELASHMTVLVDGQYGAGALTVAAELGIEVGQPVEEGGVSPLRFYRPDWEKIVEGRPGFVKVRFNGGPFQAPAERAEQEQLVLRISKVCQGRGVSFVPEPLLDPHPKGLTDLARARLMIAWTRALRELGVRARYWKLEGFVDPAAAAELAASLPEGEGVLLLGGTMAREHLAACFAAVRAQPKYQGFSMGRTIFWEPYLTYLADPHAPGVAEGLTARYLEVVDLWQRATAA